RKNIEAFADWEEWHPFHERHLRKRPHRLANDGDPEKSENNRRNRGNEFDVRFDQSFLAASGDFAYVNRRTNSQRNGDEQRNGSNHDRADEQRNDSVPVLPKTGRYPVRAEEK